MTAKITKRQIFVMLKFCRGFLSSSFVEIWFSSVERDELSVTQKYFQVVHLLGFGFVTEISLVQIVSGVLFLSSVCSLTFIFYFDAPCTQVTMSWSGGVYLFGHALGWKYFQHVTVLSRDALLYHSSVIWHNTQQVTLTKAPVLRNHWKFFMGVVIEFFYFLPAPFTRFRPYTFPSSEIYKQLEKN